MIRAVSDQYYDWFSKNDYLLVKGQLKATAFLQTFVDYPPSQRPASFNVEGVRRQVEGDRQVVQGSRYREIATSTNSGIMLAGSSFLRLASGPLRRQSSPASPIRYVRPAAVGAKRTPTNRERQPCHART
jgi:hypothetical protein